MKIYWNWDLIIIDFIRDKSFVLNLSSVTNNIAFKVKLIKLTELIKLMFISANSSNLAKSSMKLKPSTYNDELICN